MVSRVPAMHGKFFSSRDAEMCRCGALTESHEEHVRPWVRDEEEKRKLGNENGGEEEGSEHVRTRNR